MLLAGAAHAAPLRLAVVYGHNGGTDARKPLRFAEADAARVAGLLTELGGVATADLKLLQGRSVRELGDALDWARTRAKSNPDTLLLVYLSAHADAKEGLLPGAERLDWRALKDRVAATQARVRVTIVDGCHSSGMIEASARTAPAFTLQAEELTVKGDAFITSSAESEPSVEAGALGGSVFTQHLLAGLRGGADRSGDLRVSLDEAYRYAYERTQDGESGQHPGFATRLSGYGELMLTSVGDDRAGVLVPAGLESLAVRATSGERFLFARGPAPGRLALPAGEWVLELTRKGATKEGHVAVTRGFVRVDEGQLTLLTAPLRIVRLASALPCVTVRVLREDPATIGLRDAVKRAFGDGCDATRPVTASIDRVQGKLRLRAEGQGAPLEQLGTPGGEAVFVDALRGWLSGR